MEKDIDNIIERVKQRVPEVVVEQLIVKYPADDDGLWWFRLPGIQKSIQLESSYGVCPFMVEHDDMQSSSEAETAHTTDEAVEKILSYLLRLKSEA